MKRKLSLIIITSFMLFGCQSGQNYPFVGQGQTDDNVTDAGQAATGEYTEEIEETLTLPKQLFNDTEEVDGRQVIRNVDNYLLLVNKQYYLPADYVPSDLVRADVAYSFGDEQLEKAFLRDETAAALTEMFTAAQQDGVELIAVSGYRSYERQQTIFDYEVSNFGQERAEEAVAIPGQSEHQTGLSMDISSRSNNCELNQEFENTAEGQWLAEHAHEYGFILRYPKDKEDITGYKYEPWHFRYVGKEYSNIIYEKDITLEEFFELVTAI
ncbi:MAG: D-alanyl-D-alanine carboxypeptidase family protein [Bacillus sp. (in: firmicutes)]